MGSFPQDQVTVPVTATKSEVELCPIPVTCCAVNHCLKSVVREIRTLRSVGIGGRRLPPMTRWCRVTGIPIAASPVASSMSLFNTQGLFRILIESRNAESIDTVKNFARNTIIARHHGEEDITVITQDAVMATFNQIFSALTMSIGGIGAISLRVAGILIMNVMLVSVSQRTGEIGLLKAVGAARGQILALFLAESVLLSLSGAVVGLAIGLGGAWGTSLAFPAMDVSPPGWAIIAGVSMSLVTGVVFGIMPARRASALEPIQALAKR